MNILKKQIFILTATVAFVLIGAGVWLLLKPNKTTPRQTPPTVVKLGRVLFGAIPNIVTTTGNIVAEQQTDITTKINGYVTKIYYHEGDEVHSGDILVELDKRSEQDALAEAKATSELSQLEYNRDAKLRKKQLITEDVFYQTKISHEKNQAALQKAETNLSNKTITAPFNGTIGARTISVGQYIATGTPIVNLIDKSHLRVEYTLPSRELSKIKIGQDVIVTNAAYPKQRFKAKVSYIADTIDPNSQTFNVHAILADNTPLKPGLFVNVEQTLGPPIPTLTVLSNAVLSDLEGHYVFTVKNGRAVKIPVTIAKRLNGAVAIKTGLQAGQSIIIQGQDQVKNGELVIESVRKDNLHETS